MVRMKMELLGESIFIVCREFVCYVKFIGRVEKEIILVFGLSFFKLDLFFGCVGYLN